MDNNEPELKTKLEKFFVYSYLNGGDISDTNTEHYDSLLLMAINKAYKDATQRKAYDFLIDNNRKNVSDSLKSANAQYLYNKISQYNSKKFKEWHEEVCKNIVRKYEDFGINVFTYGNAQKWLNMALKYLWLLDRLPEDIKEENLHAPIDSYILQKLKKLGVQGVTGSGETFYYNKKCWSKIDKYNEYMELQVEIRERARAENKSVIEWENEAWIEMAVARKNAEREKRKE